MAYPHKWSPISYKSSAGQRKHIGQRPMLYRWTTPGCQVKLCNPSLIAVCINHAPAAWALIIKSRMIAYVENSAWLETWACAAGALFIQTC